MKSFIRYCLSRNLPFKLCFVLTTLGGVALALLVWRPLGSLSYDDLIWFVATLVLFPLMCFFGSFLVAPMLFFSLYEYGARLNGAPFSVGDRVRILVGPHRDRVVEIYELWDERLQVRVNLDPESKDKVKDVFSYNEICREDIWRSSALARQSGTL